ncbi:MAG: hypothetical protein HFH61_01690, partial [Lachnospiraceae bacterium]|nr:hypothetical protein [Lachnospiraceae bacterium]
DFNKEEFTNAIPRKAQMGTLQGKYFSNRLYHALVRYITDAGTNIHAVDKILKNDYGCSIIVEDYSALTKDTTGETAAAFEQFKPEELLAILEMFAEMPEGFHKTPGLEYLVRRIDGSVNPIYPAAGAVSWVDAEHGFIEFMDQAFLGSHVEDTFRLVLHEKTHFLWKNMFSEELKAKWQEVGGWYQTEDDPDGWATTKETEFVSAYAHAVNPNEDMAESVAYYIIMPNKLESRSEGKYNFIRNYIMNGEIYMTQLREDLTFEVYNLYPDYAFPGRMVGLDLEVEGDGKEDKRLTVTAQLDTQGKEELGANKAYLRIHSEAGTHYDMNLYPLDGDTSVLRGTLKISKYADRGYWSCEQIEFTDLQGNERFVGTGRFGWKLYVDNLLADTEKPQYVANSLKVDLEPGVLEGKDVTYVNVSFKATDNVGVESSYCEMSNKTHGSYRIEEWGEYDPETQTCKIRFIFTEYMQSGEYAITYIAIKDYAQNQKGYYFYSDNSGAESYTTFVYESDQSDYEAPEINLNNITLTAYPMHPENPNGETVLIIDYFAKDNASGLDLVSYTLLDPMGKTHFEYHNHENYGTTFFKGDPTAWKKYTIRATLPEGSAPGVWGVLEMEVCDKAGNFRKYNFLEILHFAVDTDESPATYALDCSSDELKEKGTIPFSIQNKNNEVEYVWECVNGTGEALIDQSGKLTGISAGTVTVIAYEKDDSSKYGMREVTVTHAVVEDKEVAPTCTTSGLTRGEHCEICKEVIVAQEEIEAKGHGETEVRGEKEASCQEAGYTGDVYCKDCDQKLKKGKEIEAKHGETEVRGEKEASCQEAGYTGDVYCKDCDQKVEEGEEIEAKGHGETEVRGEKEASCQEAGYTGDVYCKDCGQKVEEGKEIAVKHGETEVRGKKEASCQEAGYTGDVYCKDCGQKLEEGKKTAVKDHGETEVRGEKEASCQKAGYTGDVYCKDCGQKLEGGKEISKTEHVWGNGKVTSKPSYQKEGIRIYTCQVCKETKSESVQKLSLEQAAISDVQNVKNGISIRWHKVKGAAGYNIYRKTGNKSWTKIAQVKKNGVVNYIDATAKNGTKYAYAIGAFNGTNVGKYDTAGKEIIRLQATKISMLKNKSEKSLVLRWKKNAKASGCQIQISTSRKFKNARNIKVSSKQTSKTIKKLKLNKKYYVRVRSYARSGKNVNYSSWSPVKSRKVVK